MIALITGSNGFIGRNLRLVLERHGHEVIGIDVDSDPSELPAALAKADVLFHLAGINRPKDLTEYDAGNRVYTEDLVELIRSSGKSPTIVFASSTQAELDNPYGQSKLGAENALSQLGDLCPVVIFRLTNVFGKWARPNYNSGVTTFCHNIANGLPVEIHNPAHTVCLIHVDDVVAAFLKAIEDVGGVPAVYRAEAGPTRTMNVAELADLIRSFRAFRETLYTPDFGDWFVKKLYATYLTYLPADDIAYGLDVKTDDRGFLAEVLRWHTGGQIFISRTKPGITRGNHYHDTKTEKFLVVEGSGMVRMRHVESDEVLEFPVDGMNPRVVDIPVGYTHSIQNVGATDLVTLFWACEPFDANNPDTYFVEVLPK